MEGTSAAEAAYRCHCIAAVKPLRHPKTRKCLRLPSLKQRDEELRFLWQVRYYDFPVWTEAKRIEKLRYIHRNPVKRGLVERPEDWKWSSFVHYATGTEGIVEIESQWTARRREQMAEVLVARAHPPAQNAGRVGQPLKEG